LLNPVIVVFVIITVSLLIISVGILYLLEGLAVTAILHNGVAAALNPKVAEHVLTIIIGSCESFTGDSRMWSEVIPAS